MSYPPDIRNNVVIVTEDSASGKKLFSYISKSLYKGQYAVVGAGGNRNFYNTLIRLNDLHILHKGTIVLLAVDNFDLNASNNPALSLTKRLAHVKHIKSVLKKCERYVVKDIGGYFLKTDYMSIEESVMSYKKLDAVTEPSARYSYNTYDKEMLDTYLSFPEDVKGVLHGDAQPGFMFYRDLLYNVVQTSKQSYETVMSDMLNAVSKRNYAAHMEITKHGIGMCLHADCAAASKEKGVDCSLCALNTNYNLMGLKTGHSKLSSLVRESRLKHVFNKIDQLKHSLV